MMQKTLFSGINDRIALDREDGDIAFFHALMLKLEFLTKVVTAGVVACVEGDENRHGYSLEYKLVRAESVGRWAEVLNDALQGPPSQSMPAVARDLTRDLTERVGLDDWRYKALQRLGEASTILGAKVELGAKESLRRFFEIGAGMRNRSRGHGATMAAQCSGACPHLEAALNAVEQNTIVLRRSWVHLHQNLSKKYRVTPLLNDHSPFDYLKRTRDAERFLDGVYMHLGNYGEELYGPVHVRLVFTDSDLLDIWLPNGGSNNNKFEVLSYATNDTRRESNSNWSTPPQNLPSSETQGAGSLELVGNIFTNAPPAPRSYVSRAELESSLTKELLNSDRHPIVTLTGRGGIGKTTVALKAIADMSRLESPPYEVVLWISARDIDLLDSGPKPVSQKVFTQRDMARAAVDLLESSQRHSKCFDYEKFFQGCLKEGAAGSTLFVLDNFETLSNPADVFEWVDTYIRPPNKVLITTRFRDFKGDYPIDVSGMSDNEATALIDGHSAWLDIGHLMSQKIRERLIEESEGHPYVIKILLGQIAKQGSANTPLRVVATKDHLLDALFRRTYDALSHAAQRVFLLLSSWLVHVPEVAVEAVLLRPGTQRFDVTEALDEVVRYSLVERTNSDVDDGVFVGAPQPAAMFGRRELLVSPLKASVEADREILMDFGAGKKKDAHRGALPRIENFIQAVAKRVSAAPDDLDKKLPVLEDLAQQFPRAYSSLADLVLEVGEGAKSKEKAKSYLRCFIQDADIPQKRSAWLRLGDLCRAEDDAKGEVHAICEAALLPTTDLKDLSNAANQLNNSIRRLKGLNVEDAWSTPVRDLLTKVIRALDGKIKGMSATDCSRLAWLHLNVGDKERALEVARMGTQKDPANHHCQSLIERLNQG